MIAAYKSQVLIKNNYGTLRLRLENLKKKNKKKQILKNQYKRAGHYLYRSIDILLVRNIIYGGGRLNYRVLYKIQCIPWPRTSKTIRELTFFTRSKRRVRWWKKKIRTPNIRA